jgi:predicted transposase YbfD/YdcC
MHCQKDTAAAIRNAQADYLLAVKDNQKSLHEDIKLFFDDAGRVRPAGCVAQGSRAAQPGRHPPPGAQLAAS